MKYLMKIDIKYMYVKINYNEIHFILKCMYYIVHLFSVLIFRKFFRKCTNI